MITKIGGCKDNPEKLPTTKVGAHIPCGYSMSTTCSCHDIKNKYDAYRGKDCMKNICKSLKEHAMKIINFKRKWKRKWYH